jgi:hypothetical protein
MPLSLYRTGWRALMKNIILKATLYGFVTGIILFVIAPLGLSIPLIENLKPLLAPGALLTRALLASTSGALPIVIALILNCLVYALIISGVLLSRKR